MVAKKRGKLIWSTGLPGCDRKSHLERLEKYCQKNGKKIRIYNVGDTIFEIANKINLPISKEKVLNTPPNTMNALRTAVLERLLAKKDQDLVKHDVVIINLHTRFLWKGGFIPAYNIHYMKAFDPDMFVCFIDSADKILQRLNNRKQWKNQYLTEEKIWLWQHEEVNNTETYRFLFGEKNKPFYVIPVTQPEKTLYYLMFEPWRPRVYAQMPISHLDEKELEKVNAFIKWMWKYFIIFDPLTIDIKYTIPITKVDKWTRDNQTVYRDRYWHIGQSELCIAYMPQLVFTAGVVDETREAQDTGKDCFWIFSKEPGPFETYLVEPSKIFKTLPSFKRYVTQAMVPEIEEKKRKFLEQEGALSPRK